MTILLVTGACSPLMDHLARESAKARGIPRFGVLFPVANTAFLQGRRVVI